MGVDKSGRSDFPIRLGLKDIERMAMSPVQIPLVASGLSQDGLNMFIRIKQLETYLQEHACIPDFVVVMDE